jgi:hypothetical protein
MARVGVGTIGPGAAEAFDVVLTAGTSHRVYVHPQDQSVDFDLTVLDEHGNVIDQDLSTSADAFCVVTPKWTGPFRMLVTSAAGASRYEIVVED